MEVDQDEVGLAANEEALHLMGVRGERYPAVTIRVERLLHKTKTGQVVADHHNVGLGQETVQTHLGRWYWVLIGMGRWL
jgi:hypothetical protein